MYIFDDSPFFLNIIPPEYRARVVASAMASDEMSFDTEAVDLAFYSVMRHIKCLADLLMGTSSMV